MISGWRDTLTAEDRTIRDVLVAMGKHRQQIALVVDDDDQLLGTVTDGDVRRSIIHEISADRPIRDIMNSSPATAHPSSTRSEQLGIMSELAIHHLPLVEERGRVVGLIHRERLLESTESEKPNTAVLLAGGLGKRLQPLTDNIPKPLLKLGGRPILETIIRQLRDHGITQFYVSLNHMGDQIKSYFGNGAKLNVSIKYLEETTPLGTAGPLSLISPVPADPILVMNGDILTSIDFSSLLDFHRQQGADLTLSTKEFDIEIPYGVVNMDRETVQAIFEKPVKKFLVSAGIYVIEPHLLEGLILNKQKDMPEFIRGAIDNGKNVAGFPIYEYWLDIGQIEEFKQASGDYERVIAK